MAATFAKLPLEISAKILVDVVQSSFEEGCTAFEDAQRVIEIEQSVHHLPANAFINWPLRGPLRRPRPDMTLLGAKEFNQLRSVNKSFHQATTIAARELYEIIAKQHRDCVKESQDALKKLGTHEWRAVQIMGPFMASHFINEQWMVDKEAHRRRMILRADYLRWEMVWIASQFPEL